MGKFISWTASGPTFPSPVFGTGALLRHAPAPTRNLSPLPQNDIPSTLPPETLSSSSSVSFAVPNSSFHSTGGEIAAEDNPLRRATLPPGVSFKVFRAGITEVFLRHPLGRKLVFATYLEPLLNEFSVRDFLRNGFVVHGTFSDITSKLKQASPQKLKYVNEDFLEETKNRKLTFIYYLDGSPDVENGPPGLPFSTSFSPSESATEFHVEHHEVTYPPPSGDKHSRSLPPPPPPIQRTFHSHAKERISSALCLRPFPRHSSHPPGNLSVASTVMDAKRRSTPGVVKWSPKRSYRRASLPDGMTIGTRTAAGAAKDNVKGMIAASPPRRHQQVREEKWRAREEMKRVGTSAAIAGVHTKNSKMTKVVAESTKEKKKVVALSHSKDGGTACKSCSGRGTAPCNAVPVTDACSFSRSLEKRKKKGDSQLLFHPSTGHSPKDRSAGGGGVASRVAHTTPSLLSTEEMQQSNLSAQEGSLQSVTKKDTLPFPGPGFQPHTSESSPCGDHPIISSVEHESGTQPHSIHSPLKLMIASARSETSKSESLFHVYDSNMEGVEERESSSLPYFSLQSSSESYSNKIVDGNELAAVLNVKDSSDLCVIKLKLTIMKSNYVLIEFQQNSGSAACFSKAVTAVGRILEAERVEAMRDTLSFGESELM